MVETLSNARMISRRYLSDAGNRTFIVAGCLVLAIVVQGRLVDLTSPHLALYLWIILLLGAMAAAVLQLSVGDDRASVETVPSAAVAPIPAIPLAVVGLGCAAESARLVATDEWNAQWWWLAAMALPLLGLIADAVWRRSRLSPMKAPVDPRELAGLILLVAVSLVLRLVNLTASPPLLHGDEASCGLYGRLFNAGHSPLLSISWFGLPMLSYAISGVGLHFFGDNVTGLRTINAVIGTASIVLLYFLGKEWFGRRAAVLAAVLLCFAFLHLELSRDGLHYVQGPACITLSLYLCTLWLKRGGIVTAYLTGMSFALALQVYWSARIAPLLVAGLLGFLFLRYRALLLARWRELAWVGVGTVTAGWPVAALFRANPGTFNGHQGAVSIFSNDPNTKGHLISQYGHIGTLDLIHQQTWKVLTTFFAHPDSSSLFEWWPKPMLDTVMAALLPAAIVLALFRWKRWEYTVCLTWFGSIVLAGIVTIDPPIWPRLFALMPAAALLIGVLLADVSRLLETQLRPRSLAIVALLPALALMAGLNLYNAFVDYPDVTRQIAIAPTDVGNFLAHAPGANRTVMLSDGGYFLSYEPIQFLAPRAAGCTLLPNMPASSCPIYGSSRLFILLPGRVRELPQLQRQRPGGKVVTIVTYEFGTARVLAYELPSTPVSADRGSSPSPVHAVH